MKYILVLSNRTARSISGLGLWLILILIIPEVGIPQQRPSDRVDPTKCEELISSFDDALMKISTAQSNSLFVISRPELGESDKVARARLRRFKRQLILRDTKNSANVLFAVGERVGHLGTVELNLSGTHVSSIFFARKDENPCKNL